MGLPRGRNIGIEAATTPVVAFTDANRIPDRDWLELGLARMNDTAPGLLAGGITIPVGSMPTIATLVDSTT